MYNLGMRIRLTKWGNSLGIRLPKVFAVQMGFHTGEEVDVELRKNAIVVSPVETLDALLKLATPETLHGETDTGKAVGNELW